MKLHIENWLEELQKIIKNDKELKSNAEYCTAVFDLVRTGIEDGGMFARDKSEIKECVEFFKDLIRENYML